MLSVKLRTAMAVRIGTNTGASDSDDIIGRIGLFSGGLTIEPAQAFFISTLSSPYHASPRSRRRADPRPFAAHRLPSTDHYTETRAARFGLWYRLIDRRPIQKINGV